MRKKLNKNKQKLVHAWDDVLSDKTSFNARTGGELKRISLKHLDPVVDLIKRHSPYRCNYDVHANFGTISFDEMSFTEIFKTAVYLAPMRSDITWKLCNQAILEYSGDIEADHIRILKLIDMRDKYVLSDVQDIKIKSLILLPGTNLFNRAIVLRELSKIMYLDQDAYIKPHPLTDDSLQNFLGNLYGVSRIIKKNFSGFRLLESADRVYTTSASELGLYSKLLGKVTIDITKFEYMSDATYSPLYRYLSYPYDTSYEALVKVLSSPLSGVFFHNDPDLESKIRYYFDVLDFYQRDHVMYSNIEYIDKLVSLGGGAHDK